MMVDTEIKKELPVFNHVYQQENGLYKIRSRYQSIQVSKDNDGKLCLYICDDEQSFVMSLEREDVDHLVSLLTAGGES